MAVTRPEWRKGLKKYIFADFPTPYHIEFERIMQIVPAVGIGIILTFLGSIWEYGEGIRIATIDFLVWFAFSFIFSISSLVIRFAYVAEHQVKQRIEMPLSKATITFGKFFWAILLFVSGAMWFVPGVHYLKKTSNFGK